MLIACPCCGNPVCSDCGTHVNSGAVGAPTIQRIVAPIQQSGFTKIPIITWDSVKPGTNETYAHYYGTVIWAYASWYYLQKTGNHWYRNVEWVGAELKRAFATPASMLAYVGQSEGIPASSVTNEMIARDLGYWYGRPSITDNSLSFDQNG